MTGRIMMRDPDPSCADCGGSGVSRLRSMPSAVASCRCTIGDSGSTLVLVSRDEDRALQARIDALAAELRKVQATERASHEQLLELGRELERVRAENSNLRDNHRESEKSRGRLVDALHRAWAEGDRWEAIAFVDAFVIAALEGHARGLAFRLAELEADRGIVVALCGECGERSFARLLEEDGES